METFIDYYCNLKTKLKCTFLSHLFTFNKVFGFLKFTFDMQNSDSVVNQPQI